MDWPSLRFHFKVKRSSMQVRGQQKFTTLANPAAIGDGSQILYGTLATFTDSSTVTNYSLVNGVSYISRGSRNDTTAAPSVRCLDVDVVPPVNAIVSALNEATPVSSSGGVNIECSSGSLYRVLVNGINFVLCLMGSLGFTMHGSDLDIEVEYLVSRVDIVAPSFVTSKCEKVASPSSVTSVGRSLIQSNLFI